MSSLPRVSYPGKQAWIGLLVSGVWFSFLVMLVGVVGMPVTYIAFMIIERHGGAPISPIRRWLIEMPPEVRGSAFICAVTFTAAFFSAHSRWIYRPALSAVLACLIAMSVLLGPVCWELLRGLAAGTAPEMSGRDLLVGFASIYLPLAGAALGGSIGARRFDAE